ncbi:hypothetical protein SS1G_14368 [Sclerotinia sclerotiorum 1980 UF-70]|uniref:HTH psq-type domain-containing protein n=1 Tax=Sclerotinia sclerotiorum (strain ATCC 18683 / 1980 / Ss-1) TaxID=665079 RepID=A7F9T7_SCLS1|nr:hypothetical protein SS1G_14368 [Sclerotinia sclerotiorum 1980 UF-70]EDO00498.1 hypothetical protein SS1G_14368 [Sclerotinia sclerotiorum 1980 UF-70]
MESNNQEGRILLAIEAINKDQKLSIRKAVKLYNIPRTKIQHRIDGTTPCIESRANSHNLTKLEEEAKYGIIDSDFYNFDETSFMISIICPEMVVTSIERNGRSKIIQSSNREWATVIIYGNKEGEIILLFLVIQE